MISHFKDYLPLFEKAWSSQSSSLYTLANPARGQCSVTAIILQEYCGGSIKKTRINDAWHYYNWINGKRVDLTCSQFQLLPQYTDTPSSLEEAWSDTNQEQVEYLRQAIQKAKKEPTR
ncbi:hypothetical protein IC620_07610 [Hazenella sp. IB182357]|uniref:Uncharacterized protein n=1 Tax=Polycladospora coralii TaxID=2771432 RepID=A0A926N5Y5_9BACL|nr:hypothetical protein [Polycladospora coralii]MBD1372229.1 hypothetical protein [Polycladospora coralii]MBS7530728.1 hypothetical protein [Polycladospora coralii]